jgi:hypothetical protein
MVLGTVALIGYAWLVAGLRPFTGPENVLVAVPIVVVAVFAARRSRSGPAPAGRSVPAGHGAAVWVGLLGAVVAWELVALFSSPRDDHPTLSSIADRIMSVHVGRAFVVVLWLAIGVALARRPLSRRVR